MVHLPTFGWFAGWWQLKCFLCSPRKLWKISNLTNIFQRGWNHQLVIVSCLTWLYWTRSPIMMLLFFCKYCLLRPPSCKVLHGLQFINHQSVEIRGNIYVDVLRANSFSQIRQGLSRGIFVTVCSDLRLRATLLLSLGFCVLPACVFCRDVCDCLSLYTVED